MNRCSNCKSLQKIDDFVLLKNGKTKKTCLRCSMKKRICYDNHTDFLTQYIRHQKLYRNLLNEFKEKSAYPVHIYNSKFIFLDIRDIYSPSNDKEISYVN